MTKEPYHSGTEGHQRAQSLWSYQQGLSDAQLLLNNLPLLASAGGCSPTLSPHMFQEALSSSPTGCTPPRCPCASSSPESSRAASLSPHTHSGTGRALVVSSSAPLLLGASLPVPGLMSRVCILGQTDSGSLGSQYIVPIAQLHSELL